mmetsp:Transcript_29570/g.71441  ORF Transcript_29570/g.71441 Transcript_29570/m.71441 type:complete len:240 (-) Transcript_29570:16-735(-)
MYPYPLASFTHPLESMLTTCTLSPYFNRMSGRSNSSWLLMAPLLLLLAPPSSSSSPPSALPAPPFFFARYVPCERCRPNFFITPLPPSLLALEEPARMLIDSGSGCSSGDEGRCAEMLRDLLAGRVLIDDPMSNASRPLPSSSKSSSSSWSSSSSSSSLSWMRRQRRHYPWHFPYLQQRWMMHRQDRRGRSSSYRSVDAARYDRAASLVIGRENDERTAPLFDSNFSWNWNAAPARGGG